MKEIDLKKRTKAFAVQVVSLVRDLPQNRTADILGRQLLRCGTSVGANYRSACRAKSLADFIAKMSIVEEEADEVCYWLELLAEANIIKETTVTSLWQEANELVAIAVSSVKTARKSSFRIKQSKI